MMFVMPQLPPHVHPQARRGRGARGRVGIAVVAIATAGLFPGVAVGHSDGTATREATPVPPPAWTARAMSATDEAHLHYVRGRSAGARLFEEGTAHGTLPGTVRAECDLGATFEASVTIVTNAGTIRGHGTATSHASGIYESLAGTLTVTGGTGRYAHAHGRAKLYGVFDRRTYALTVQTTGSLRF
jgi:hypothetical protein